MTFDYRTCEFDDIVVLGRRLRTTGPSALETAELGKTVARTIRDSFVADGRPQTVAANVLRTRRIEELDAGDRERAMAQSPSASPSTLCLVGIEGAGEVAKGDPLFDDDVVVVLDEMLEKRVPLLAEFFLQIGLAPDWHLSGSKMERSFDWPRLAPFVIGDVRSSNAMQRHADFAATHGVESATGFAGLLPTVGSSWFSF